MDDIKKVYEEEIRRKWGGGQAVSKKRPRRVLFPSDLRQKYERRPEYPVQNSLLSTHRRCPECGETFRRKNNRQLYCSYTCRDRRKSRRYREERRKKGLCVTCRKPIAVDPPPSATTGRPAAGAHYCRECREYFRERHQRYK